MLELTKIKKGAQARKSINESTIAEYVEHIESGGSFPPIIVFFDSKTYWLADGWHRLIAHERIGCLTIFEEVKVGNERDALRYALGANSKHGLPRTNADKRNAVEIALADKEWAKLSDVKIANLCAVSQPFVLKMRHELAGVHKPKKVSVTPITVIPPPPKPAPVLDVEKQEDDRYIIGILAEEAEPEYTELDAAHDQISFLQDMLAVKGSPEEEKKNTADIISGLREEIKELNKQIKTLKATEAALIISRDSFQMENASMMKQIARQRKEIEKLKAK